MMATKLSPIRAFYLADKDIKESLYGPCMIVGESKDGTKYLVLWDNQDKRVRSVEKGLIKIAEPTPYAPPKTS